MLLKSEKQSLLICFLVVWLAYLPVTSFQFAIKNDFFRSYFPLKHFMSEALKDGIFPLWNPYLNYGFPIYGDMSLAWWNPGTWIIACFPGYNVWTFTLEQTGYLMLAVLGMHKLAARWTGDIHIRSMAAVAYACCGYFTGQLQHFNWIAAAGTLPVLMHFLIRFLEKGGIRNLAATAFSAIWFATVAHPGLIIGLGFFCLPVIASADAKMNLKWRRSAMALALTLLGCAGMLYGYSEVLPFTNRNSDVSSIILREGATTLPSWISLALPLPVMKGDWFSNDISLRNCYIGILPLLGMLMAFGRDTPRIARFWGIVGLAFLFISSDLFLPVYKRIPPLNYIRLSGELRVFALLAFILAFTVFMDRHWLRSPEKLVIPLKWFRLLMIVVALISLFMLPGTTVSTWVIPDRPGIRDILATVHPAVLFLAGALIQVLLSTALIASIQKQRLTATTSIVFAEFILATLLTLPFTGVGTRSVAQLDRVFGLAPKGVPIPANLPEKTVVAGYPEVSRYAGNWSLMSRQIAQEGLIEYPLIFGSTLEFMQGNGRKEFLERSPFFLRSGKKLPGCEPAVYKVTEMDFNLGIEETDTLILKQNMFKGWQLVHNGVREPIVKTPEGFMGIPLTKGKHELKILFRKQPVRALLIFQFMLTGLMLAVYILRGRTSSA